MSVLDINKIDFIGTDRQTGEVILTISDHINWDDTQYHLSALQEKINAYLNFIDSEEIYKEYPNAIGKKLIVQITGKYHINKEGHEFIEKVAAFLNNGDIGFEVKYGA
ncbi:DUF6572 domain-containing protein [Pedobacter sp. UBA5917]|jgi:hypothetical protein|uniref:DUF6572 domain-containing protein n=1 Tax=Pedobacter sp. UBA5917 TaxID=1947061 RepID=UPI0025D34BE1|nr:DUF6572 domain-containing protein [Pedobacter sp. UBA5917]